MKDGSAGIAKRSAVFARFVRIVVLIDLGILLIFALVYWSAGWRAAEQAGHGVIVAGVITIVVGVASQLGGWGLTRSPDVLLAQPTGREGFSACTGRTTRDLLRAYGFLITMVDAGLVSVGIGESNFLIWA